MYDNTTLLGRLVVFLSVEAYIATLLSRLETNDGRFWSLLVKVNDSTATVDAIISDQVCQRDYLVQVR